MFSINKIFQSVTRDGAKVGVVVGHSRLGWQTVFSTTEIL